MSNHRSDCALHNAPAMRPEWCDCDGVTRKPTLMGKVKAWIVANLEYVTGRA